MPYIFLAALAVVLLLLLLQKLENAETRLIVITLKWTLVGVMGLAALYLALVGRLFLVAALVVLLILLLKGDIQAFAKRNTPPRSLPHPMTKKEAASLLKVDLKASSEEIEEAYQKIKTKDSTARDRLLQARETLLKGRKQTKG